jgi:hypothetical protein
MCFSFSFFMAVKFQRLCLSSTPKTVNESVGDLLPRRITRSLAAKVALNESEAQEKLQSEGSCDIG